MLLSGESADRQARYVTNWLRAREAWYAILRMPNCREKLPTNMWRTYLNDGPKAQADPTSNKSGQARLKVMGFFEDVFKKSNLRDQEVSLMWFGQTVVEPSSQLCREVVWELYEIGFRTELVSLDDYFPHQDREQHIQKRWEWLSQIFPGHSALHIPRLPTKDTGLASIDVLERGKSLEALRQLLITWPGVPSELSSCSSLATCASTRLIEHMEDAMAKFYVDMFFKFSGRAAILPHRFPFASSASSSSASS